MVLATLLLLCPILQADDAAKVAAAANANVERQTLSVTASHDISKDATAVPALPSAPQPKAERPTTVAYRLSPWRCAPLRSPLSR